MISKRSKALDIKPSVRKDVRNRDHEMCIFCQMGYPPKQTGTALQVMHFVNRGSGGLGIPENLALGCISHHRALDEGSEKERTLLKAAFRSYLRGWYPDWDENNLRYRK